MGAAESDPRVTSITESGKGMDKILQVSGA